MASLFDSTILSEEGIRSVLRVRGGLPIAYRVTGWKFLLRLPGNSKEMARLVSKGPHPAVLASLNMRYPLRDRKLFRKLVVVISALAHWSSIMAEVEFLPNWVYPFIVVFSQDDLGAFEACLSFFLHWGSRLLVTFPQPPVPVLTWMELSLRRADRELATHLKSLKVGALSFGWPLLRSAFSEVFDREAFLRLIDHVLANARQPELLEAAAIGFAVASRAQLLVLGSTGEAEEFFRRRQPSSTFDFERMFRVMACVSKFGEMEEWKDEDHRVVSLHGRGVDGAMAASPLLRSAPKGFEPLPRTGKYPFYDGYPQFVVNYQNQMRERVMMHERDTGHKCLLVEELRRSAEIISSRERALEHAENEAERDVEN